MAVGDNAREAMGLGSREQQGKELTPLDRRIERTRGMELAFRDAVASGLKPETLVRDAITALRNTPDLVKCEEGTFFGALMSAAQLGLRPNVPSLGHGWVLPYYSGRRSRFEAQWILGYQGMVELGYKSGLVAKITTDTIYANETYRVRRGTADELIHEPILDPAERGEPVAHYAIVWLQTGQCLWRVMPDADVRKIMDRFAARNKERAIVGPWRDDYLAMAQKTPLRALWRFMPKTEILALALDTDGQVRELNRDDVRSVTIVRDDDRAEPDAAGSSDAPASAEQQPAPAPGSDRDEPVDAEVVPDPPEPEPDEPQQPPTSGRQPIKSNATRKALIDAIEQHHGPDWATAAEIVTGGQDVYALDVATTDELRSILAVTTEAIREYIQQS